MATIYLVRHGQASFGQQDYDKLSPIGEQQAQITGEWLKTIGRPISLFGCGTLFRQQQTLSGIYEGMKHVETAATPKPDLVLSGLNELDVDDIILSAYPEFSCRRQLDLHVIQKANPSQAFFEMYRDALAQWAADDSPHTYKEGWQAFKERTLNAVLTTVRELQDNQSALLVSSAGVIANIVLQILGVPDANAYQINRHIRNASITTIEARKGRLGLHGFNNYAHLEQAGERKLITRI